MKTGIRLAFTIAVAGLGTTPVLAQQPRRAEVAKLAADANVPSVSIARVENYRIVWTMAVGQQAPGVPATNRSLYNIASMTKPITAEVVLRLASEGRLSLDEKMAPTWTDPDLSSDPRVQLLTPRLALSHRTGFPNWRGSGPLAFAHDPGTYGYSGEGYRYVATFAERRTGERLDQLAAETVFRERGLRETSYTQQPWFAGRVARPFTAAGQWLTSTMTQTPVAADLVYSTPHDYARFMIGVMRDQGLASAIATERRRVQTDSRIACAGEASVCPPDRGLTLGWEIANFGPRTYLMHTGRDPGLFTFGYMRPDTGSGLIIFTNGENGAKLVIPLLRMTGADPEYLHYLEAR